MLITLFAYRSIISILGQIVVPEFSSLGDTGHVRAGHTFNKSFQFGTSWFLDSNQVWNNVTAGFSVLMMGNKFLVNLAFQTLAFVGIYQVLRALPISLRKRMILLLYMPSFTLWSSITSKEAIMVFAMGYAMAYLIRLHFGTARLGPLHLLSVWIIFVFKTHYAPALLYAWAVIVIMRNVRFKAAAALAVGLVSLVPLYYLRDTVDALAFAIRPHFLGGGSTRGIFWAEQYDVFWRAPYGMFQSFMGPTMTEAMSSGNVLQTATYLEGLVLMLIMVFYAAKNIGRLPVHAIVFSTFSLFWMMFANYPFGILNPGSATRYRADYIMFVFVIFAVFMSLEAYGIGKKRVAGPERAAGAEITPSPLPG